MSEAAAERAAGAASPRDHERPAASRVWFALVVTFVVLGIGTPLLGLRVFHGAGLILQAFPWKADVPVSVLDDRYMPVNDTVEGTAPLRTLFAEGLRSGDVRLWNPYNAGGTPLGAVPGSGLWTPWMAPFLVLPAWLAHAYVKLFELAVAGGFTYLFLRRLSLSRAAGLAGALAFMSSGFLVAWTNWAQSTTAALIPAVFWAAERAMKQRTAGAHAVAAGVFGWFALSGFPAIVGYTLYVLVPYVALRAWTTRDRDRSARAWLGRGTAVGGAFVAGVGLAAFAVLPFREWLGTLDLSYRGQGAGRPSSWRTMLTLFSPYGFGSPTEERYWAGANIVETEVFVGAAALVLVVVALVSLPSSPHRRNLTFFAVTALGVGCALFGPDPLFEPLRSLPVLSSNRVGRARSIFGFTLAVLVAHGVEALATGARARARPGRALAWTFAVALAASAGVAALVDAGFARADRVDETRTYARALLLPGVAALLAVVVVVAAFRRPRLRVVGVCALGVLMTVESLAFVRPFWARIDRDSYYPSTSTHQFLEASTGHDRMAAGDISMWPNTNVAYGLRAPTGHAFHDPAWVDVLEAADPEVMRRSTLSVLHADPAVIRSPVLDRMGVRYFVTDPVQRVLGRRPALQPARGVVHVAAGTSVRAALPIARLRAVVLRLVRGSRLADDDAEIQVRVLDADGEVVASGRRRTFGTSPRGRIEIPVAGEPLTGSAPYRVEIGLDDDEPTDYLRVGTTTEGEPVVGAVLPRDDDLRVAFADGAVVYERLRALGRIRWATRAIASHGDDALARLARGVRADTVLLDAPSVSGGPPRGGAVTDVDVVDVIDDDTDVVRVRVRAVEAGYLVVADPMQHGWVARVDGRATELLPADHAMVAVAVDAGTHEVVLRYVPPGRRLGLVVSGLTAVGIGVTIVASRVRRRRRPADERATLR